MKIASWNRGTHLGDSSSEILLAPANSNGFASGILDTLTRRFGMKTGLTPSQRLVAGTLTHAGSEVRTSF
jgi:hypothetical protein